jgi:TolB protein
VWLKSADGTDERAVTKRLMYGADRPLCWSPDGKALLYWSHSEIGWDIWSYDARTNTHKNLTQTRSGGCRSASWSSDGKRIAFLRDDPQGLYVMERDGANPRRLTSEPEDRDQAPSWSPDGRRIAFTRSGRPGASGVDQVWVLDLVQSKETRIAPQGRAPAWSPDGKRILLLSLRRPRLQPVLIAPDGSGETWLAEDDSVKGFLAWSPDGTRIAFLAQSGGNTQLRLIGHDGRRPRTPGELAGDSWAGLTWSPDGQYLAFAAGPRGHERILLVSSSDAQRREFARDGACWPAWRRIGIPGVRKD